MLEYRAQTVSDIITKKRERVEKLCHDLYLNSYFLQLFDNLAFILQSDYSPEIKLAIFSRLKAFAHKKKWVNNEKASQAAERILCNLSIPTGARAALKLMQEDFIIFYGALAHLHQAKGTTRLLVFTIKMLDFFLKQLYFLEPSLTVVQPLLDDGEQQHLLLLLPRDVRTYIFKMLFWQENLENIADDLLSFSLTCKVFHEMFLENDMRHFQFSLLHQRLSEQLNRYMGQPNFSNLFGICADLALTDTYTDTLLNYFSAILKTVTRGSHPQSNLPALTEELSALFQHRYSIGEYLFAKRMIEFFIHLLQATSPQERNPLFFHSAQELRQGLETDLRRESRYLQGVSTRQFITGMTSLAVGAFTRNPEMILATYMSLSSITESFYFMRHHTSAIVRQIARELPAGYYTSSLSFWRQVRTTPNLHELEVPPNFTPNVMLLGKSTSK